MKTIKKEIEITAPKESVWAVLLEDSYQRDWLSHFSPGSHAVTDWIVDHRVVFQDDSGMGVFGKVKEKRPYEFLSVVYEGMLHDGVDDTESEQAKAIKGGKETYMLTERNGNTFLAISSDMDDKYYDQMALAWESALQRISELSHAHLK